MLLKVINFCRLVDSKGIVVAMKYFFNFIRYRYKMKSGYFISKTAILSKRDLIVIGKNVEIQDFVIMKSFQNQIRIGKNTQINPFTVIYGGSGVFIGDDVMIAPHCMIASGNHDFKQMNIPMRHAGSLSRGPIIIEDDVWIGANCTITDGVRIGKGAVIGANTVVVKDVAPYEIIGGVVGKKIGLRGN
jgi:acetyltransferase-like isoleucine patch superfamily enzyme